MPSSTDLPGPIGPIGPAGEKKLVAIVGATASGKSDAAVLIAQRFNGEVVNADSRLFYRGMEIGTASPPEETLNAAPHHLVGFLRPDDPFNLAQYLLSATAAISGIHSRGRLPVVAGGTGQYVWGLLQGWQVPEAPPDAELRAMLEQELEQLGVAALYARLEALDPDVASATDRNNHRRLIRAIERLSAGATRGNREAKDPGYNSIVLGLFVERAELHRRIEVRIDRMLSAGWIEEVRRLISSGVDLASPAISAIGYREIAASLRGEITPDEARERTIHATNRLVRHQNNWFKRTDPRIAWIDVTDGNLERVLEPVSQWLHE
ncbi:MAG: tRNA (adenosine(37)-N6)-dimethylallyltransferase MiaA [Chloroflexi bacterium]|nr:tRNA (adenosine(37)-N6)-dimethylallyltransferase MiaA [Chloroflexota bacterium]